MCAVNDDDLCSPYMLRYVNEILCVLYEDILVVHLALLGREDAT